MVRSINQSKSCLAHGSLPWVVQCKWSDWLVGTLNQSNPITMVSLLWWGALTNQNHAWPTGGYCGVYLRRLPWEVTAGAYHGRLPQEFTMRVYCRSLLWEFTMGGYHGSLPQELTMGVYHSSLVGDNRKFEVWGIFWGLVPIIYGW